MAFGLLIIGRRTRKNFGATALVTCPNCSNKTYFELVLEKTWLEYFWIKIFPYKKRHLLECPICSRVVELWGQRLDAAKKLNRATLAYLNHDLSQEQYEAVLSEVRFDLENALEGFPRLVPAR